MKLTSFTCLAFLVNRVIDARTGRDLSFNETFDAASEGRLITLLVERYCHIANFTWVTQPSTVNVEQMEAALRDAAAGFEGRVGKVTDRTNSPFPSLGSTESQHFKGYQEFSRLFRN